LFFVLLMLLMLRRLQRRETTLGGACAEGNDKMKNEPDINVVESELFEWTDGFEPRLG
jgi:hypothetical protein